MAWSKQGEEDGLGWLGVAEVDGNRSVPGVPNVRATDKANIRYGSAWMNRLVGLVVKASASRVEYPGFESHL